MSQTHLYVCVCVYIYIYMYTQMSLHRMVYYRSHFPCHIHTCIAVFYVCVYMYIYVCVYTYVPVLKLFMCVHTYIHTYIHTGLPRQDVQLTRMSRHRSPAHTMITYTPASHLFVCIQTNTHTQGSLVKVSNSLIRPGIVIWHTQ